MKVCAQNRVWTMIQCASGAVNRMPDDGSTAAYEQYFKDYPNFLGFNFAEQFWGFGDDGRVTFPQRLQLFADLLPVCHEYGGYLAVSFTDSYYSSSKMPIAYMKRNEQMRDYLLNDPEHFLCFEKYTLKKNFLDIESNCLGAWVGGYAGQYGIRFDSSGWLYATDETDQTRGGGDFVRAAGAIPVAEHVMLTGQTMVDGPELTWKECSQESSTTTAEGYTRRNWQWFPQFVNINLDLFRKILDGTIHIPSRQEVIERTKVCVVNDINRNLDNEDEHNSYVTPEKLFDGLYRSAEDQGGGPNHWIDNRWWLKSTGRYPTIPQVYAEVAGMTSFKKSQFSKETFDSWMKDTFDEEYSGDIYAGRHENGWVTYNPYQYDEQTADGYRVCNISMRRAQGTIPLQYNSCENVGLSYAPYTLGIMKEYANRVTLYLTNYQTTGAMAADTITVNGALTKPSVTWEDRGEHAASEVTTEWGNGVLTIAVRHNGPLDISIGCVGTATQRATVPSHEGVTAPPAPPAYEGVLQYEAELADYKSVTLRKTGYNQGRDGFYGQGFAEMTGQQSGLRVAVAVAETGFYLLTLRYQADNGGQVTVGGVETLHLASTTAWATATTMVHLTQGDGVVTVTNAGGTKVFVDCIQLESIEVGTFCPDDDGEYHVELSDFIATGNIAFDAATGVVTQVPGTGQTGSLKLFLDHADFSSVTSIRVTYEGDGDIFRYLVITDNDGNSVNPSGTQGAFWSSKYSLNYTDYQQTAASQSVCKLEWVANAPNAATRIITIRDIVIKTKATGSGINAPIRPQDSSCEYYDLQGKRVNASTRGLKIKKQTVAPRQGAGIITNYAL